MGTGAIGAGLLSLLFLGVGLFVLAISARSFYRAGQLLFASVQSSVTDPVAPGDVPGSGHAVVTGTVKTGPGGEVTTPFSGTGAVACRYGMQQQSDGVGWWQVVDGEHAGQFVIEGALDRVLVDPGGAALGIDVETTTPVGADEALPAERRRALRESEVIEPGMVDKLRAGAVDEPRRYEEGTLDPGETAYVYGKVTDDDAHGKRIDGDASRAFAVSRDEPGTVTHDGTSDARSLGRLLARGVLTLVFGAVFAGSGAFVLLDAVGEVV